MFVFRLLGTVEAPGEHGPLPLGGRKQRAVLAMLLLRANETVPMERLVDGLWGDDPPETARHCIRVYVCNLRRILSGAPLDGLQTAGSGYLLRVEPEAIDVGVFRSRLKSGMTALLSDEPARACELLRQGLDLWRGPALDGLRDLPFAPPYVAHLEELRISACEQRIAADLMLGLHDQVTGELEELVLTHPFRETLWRHLIVALQRSGRQADAVGAYHRLHALLGAEMGIEPSSTLRRLVSEVCLQTVDLGAPGEDHPPSEGTAFTPGGT